MYFLGIVFYRTPSHNWLFAKAATIIAILKYYERVSAIRLSEYHGKHLPPYVCQQIYLPSFFFLPVIIEHKLLKGP